MEFRFWRAWSLLFFVFCVPSWAFTGFYAGKSADHLFSRTSQLVIARDGKRTAITVLSNYRGDADSFALIIPVPEVLKGEQVSVGDRGVLERLDAFTAARIVEKSDPDPCVQESSEKKSSIIAGLPAGGSHGVKIESAFSSGDYDLVTLSAEDSAGLLEWLTTNGYHVPKAASAVLTAAIKDGMKFLVAKVALPGNSKETYKYLRPIQFAFETEKLIVPLRLGGLSAEKTPEMTLYFITRNAAVEPVNVKAAKVPTSVEVPEFVKDKFPAFYGALLNKAQQTPSKHDLVLEYAWNLGWCDPCSTDPLSKEELRQLGVFWLDEGDSTRKSQMIWPPGGGPVEAFVTRFHFRQVSDTVLNELVFKESKKAPSFQAQYAIRHPWVPAQRSCAQASTYLAKIKGRRESEAQNLATLTGWAIEDVYKQMGAQAALVDRERKWYEKIFK